MLMFAMVTVLPCQALTLPYLSVWSTALTASFE